MGAASPIGGEYFGARAPGGETSHPEKYGTAEVIPTKFEGLSGEFEGAAGAGRMHAGALQSVEKIQEFLELHGLDQK